MTHTEIPYVSKIVDSLIIIGSEDKDLLQQHRDSFKGSVIGTHSGSFHCDEVLACTMLLYTERFAKSMIVRSRDQEVLDTLDILVDVGAEYDVDRLRLDHHQRTFTDTWNSEDKYKGIKLSSAGLVYRHFGKEVIKNATTSTWGTELTD